MVSNQENQCVKSRPLPAREYYALNTLAALLASSLMAVFWAMAF